MINIIMMYDQSCMTIMISSWYHWYHSCISYLHYRQVGATITFVIVATVVSIAVAIDVTVISYRYYMYDQYHDDIWSSIWSSYWSIIQSIWLSYIWSYWWSWSYDDHNIVMRSSIDMMVTMSSYDDDDYHHIDWSWIWWSCMIINIIIDTYEHKYDHDHTIMTLWSSYQLMIIHVDHTYDHIDDNDHTMKMIMIITSIDHRYVWSQCHDHIDDHDHTIMTLGSSIDMMITMSSWSSLWA